MDPLLFREVAGHFATGVTVVTSRRSDGSPCGLTANSFASVSLDPLLVLVCLDHTAVSHDCVVEGGAFAVCILHAGDEDLARRFASSDARDARFEGVALTTSTTDSPILEDALAWVDCRVEDVHPAGDHSIVVGRVVACGMGDGEMGEPLVFFRGRFRKLLG